MSAAVRDRLADAADRCGHANWPEHVLMLDQAVEDACYELEWLENAIRHVVRYGKLGKQSRARLKQALKVAG